MENFDNKFSIISGMKTNLSTSGCISSFLQYIISSLLYQSFFI